MSDDAMPDYSGLLSRIEQASGPSRELDRDIAEMVGWSRRVVSMGEDDYWRDGDQSWTREDDDHPPRWTASLDATVALIGRMLPGYIWSVSDGDEHGPNAFVHHPDDKDPIGKMADTPVIALLASLFYSLSTRKAKDGGLR